MYSAPYASLVERIREALSAAPGHPVAANVTLNGSKHDFALALTSQHLAVVRCVERVEENDYAALATMLREGPFVWAALVHSATDVTGPSPPLEAFHIDDLDRLITRLRELGSVADAAS